MIKNILRATSCTLAILLFSPAHAAYLSNPVGTDYEATNSNSGLGVVDLEVTIDSNGAFTLNFDTSLSFEELITIKLVNNTGSAWTSFSINYDDPVTDTFNATLGVLGTGSGNPVPFLCFHRSNLRKIYRVHR